MAKKKKGPYQKQKAGVYTMMLICSFLALVLGCVLMYLELKKYNFDIEAKDYKKTGLHTPVVERWDGVT